MILKFAGFVFFLVMFLIGFWGLTFLAHVAIAWAIFGPMETFGNNNGKYNPEKIKRKNLPNQEGVDLLFTA